MTIKFLLLVNKQGQTRLAKYFTELLSTDEKRALEGEIVRKCLARTDRQVRRVAVGVLLVLSPSSTARDKQTGGAHHTAAATVAWHGIGWELADPTAQFVCQGAWWCSHLNACCCLSCTPACMQCSIFEHRAYKVIYRRYASLFFMVGVDDDEVRAPRWGFGCSVACEQQAVAHATCPQAAASMPCTRCAMAHNQQRSRRAMPAPPPNACSAVLALTWPCAALKALPCCTALHGVLLLQNELAVLELIHCFVEVLDKHFGQVCELDIMNDPDVVSRQQQRALQYTRSTRRRHWQLPCADTLTAACLPRGAWSRACLACWSVVVHSRPGQQPTPTSIHAQLQPSPLPSLRAESPLCCIAAMLSPCLAVLGVRAPVLCRCTTLWMRCCSTAALSTPTSRTSWSPCSCWRTSPRSSSSTSSSCGDSNHSTVAASGPADPCGGQRVDVQRVAGQGRDAALADAVGFKTLGAPATVWRLL